MSDRFDKGQYVVYGKMGVCRVADKQVLAFGGAQKAEYYILEPLRDSRSSVYVPCENATLVARLRALLTKEEIDTMLSQVVDEQIAWIDDRGERSKRYRAIIAEGDRRQLIRLARCLYAQKKQRVQAGKDLSCADDAFLQECVRLVGEEFELVLGINASQVGDYIRERVEE